MTMRAIGPMRDRLEIQARTMAANSYGERVATWETVATRWGQVDPLNGRELWQAQSVRPDVSHKVTMRYYDGLSPRHRLKLGSRIFEITSVINIDNRKRFVDVTCIEEVT